MSEKKAFIFDTNFIIEHSKDLPEVVDNLRDKFEVYVTQLSIDERASQQYLAFMKLYNEIPQISHKYREVAKVSIIADPEQRRSYIKNGLQVQYQKLFTDRIIPFIQTEGIFTTIMERVFVKQAPFNSDEKASDKGFKDTLIWLSIMEYFKNDGEDSVIFVTNDSGFRKSAEELCVEFNAYTGKELKIKDNSYYSEILNDTDKTQENDKPQIQRPLPDMSVLRERIQDTISSICQFQGYDGYNERWYNTFTLKKMIIIEDVKIMFSRLRVLIEENLFETELPSNIVLSVGDSIINEASIPIGALQDALNLYEEIANKISDYLPQFFKASTSIINKQYREQPDMSDDDDDLPF